MVSVSAETSRAEQVDFTVPYSFNLLPQENDCREFYRKENNYREFYREENDCKEF